MVMHGVSTTSAIFVDTGVKIHYVYYRVRLSILITSAATWNTSVFRQFAS